MNSILKHVPKTRIPLRLENIRRVVLAVAEARGERIVDLFTDRVTQLSLRLMIARWLSKIHGVRLEIVPCKELPTNALGMHYDSYDIGTVHFPVKLNVITDDWFDTYRKARRKRGWKSIALLLDMREFDGLKPRKEYVRNHHRIICFK